MRLSNDLRLHEIFATDHRLPHHTIESAPTNTASPPPHDVNRPPTADSTNQYQPKEVSE